jgi:D-serine deaminase-like pyridoxal phosphate-dependent protein
MKLADLPTPCLVLDRGILQRNLQRMADAVARNGTVLRPHMKTAKSIDVARLALAVPQARHGGITVSTLAEAEYFAGHGITDILYAVGITPQKLEQVIKLNDAGANVMVITDDADIASVIAAQAKPPRVLIEVDTGEHRGGLGPDDPALLDIAARLGKALAGVMTHAGHSYAGRSNPQMAAIAEAERAGIVHAAARLTKAGFPCPIVSMGSSPTALHAAGLEGVTEVRAGVYMFGDLFQSQIGTHGQEDIAMTVLSSVVGRRSAEGKIVIDAGGMALSKDRSTAAAPVDFGFGLVRDLMGAPSLGNSVVQSAYQEHGVVVLDPAVAPPSLKVGDKVRVAPNHTCMTAAAHDRYFVVDGDDAVIAIWPRVNGW